MDVLDDVGMPAEPARPREYCDAKKCGAEAFVFAEVNGKELTFCGHHGTEYMPKLMEQGMVIADLRNKIGQTR